MKRFNYILGMVLSAMLLFTGCMKEDIDELRKQQEENASRIAALEAWQATVNGNITSLQQLVSALENADYVTSVTQFTTPAPGGYRITFSKTGEATIWNGAKGDTGEQGQQGNTGAAGHSPAIGVKESPVGSGDYYWTVDGEFIESGGSKMPVTGEKGADGTTPTITIGANGNWVINGNDTGVKATGNDGIAPVINISTSGNWTINGIDSGVKAIGVPGQDGKTPKVAVGLDGYWYISADGTATGNPTAGDYTGWTKSVKATGDKGDAIFAANGVDNSNANYVEFTLADGTTKIQVPKYKSIAISFAQPDIFAAGEAKTIAYGSTGTTAPTNVRVIDVPTGWKISVNTTAKTFTVTAPATVTVDNFEGEATILVLDNNSVAAVHELKVRAAGFYRVGDYYPDPCAVYESGTLVSGTAAVGVVFWLNNQSVGDHPYDKVNANGKIVGLYERTSSFLDASCIAWVTDYGTTYNAGTGWYIPAYGAKDYYNLYCAYNGMNYETWDTGKPNDISKNYTERAWFRKKITDAGGDNITDSWYWVSHVNPTGNAYCLHFNSGNVELAGYSLASYKTRAIKSF